MGELSFISRICLYVLLGIMGLLSIFIFTWQVMVMRGKAMKNCDGSFDSWHEQKSHYGIAFADVFVACPATLSGIVLVFLSPRWGFYLLALAGFWWVWANIMTTANSLRFEKPRITFLWFLTYPFGAILGLVYIAWTIINFHAIYGL